MAPEPESREYLAAIERLKRWRREYWERVFSEIPKPAPNLKPRAVDYVPLKRYRVYKESPMGRGK